LSLFKTPEQVLANMVRILKRKFPECEVLPVGSVPLGIYVGEPDLDIFIVTDNAVDTVFYVLREMFPKGMRKEGELDIWYLKDYLGYPVDLVVIDKADPKVQTLNHVKYYQERITEQMVKDVKFLKTFFKRINCYGAETGGITGICCTRLAELWTGNMDDMLIHYARAMILGEEVIIEDPTLAGRDLFASVTALKRKVMCREILEYCDGRDYGVDIDYLFDNYDRVYRVKRNKKMGLDQEWSFLYGSVNKTWNAIRNKVRWWNVQMDFDILVAPWSIYIGITLTPSIIKKDAYEVIPIAKLNIKSINAMIERGAKMMDDNIVYIKKAPFKNVSRRFEEHMFNRIHAKYTDIDRE
jgi:hypothetical protein